jgi:hypothetical protein
VNFMGVPEEDALLTICWAMICHDPCAEATPPEVLARLATVNMNPAGFMGAVLLLRLRAWRHRAAHAVLGAGHLALRAG